MLAMAKPAPAPIRVPGHHISAPRLQQVFDLRQALDGSYIDPLAVHVLAADLALGHGFTQQGRQLESTASAIPEQLRMQYRYTAVGQGRRSWLAIVQQAVLQAEVAPVG